MLKSALSALIATLVFSSACSRRDAAQEPATNESAAPSTSAPVATAIPASPPIEIAPNWPRDVVATQSGPLTIVPIRHASILFIFNNKAIYVDPTSDGVYDGLPKADIILVTHSHPDHLDAKQIGALSLDTTSIVAPQDSAKAVSANLTLNNREAHFFGNGNILVEAFPAYNNVRGPAPGQLYHPKGQGNGYLLTLGKKRVYVSGDTECTTEMKELTNIDVAFVCMRLPYTMPPKEAAECIKAFKPKIVYPYHYQTSNLNELKAALQDQSGIEVRVRDWYRQGAPISDNPLAKMLPDKAGPFKAGPLVTESQLVRREYTRGDTKISVTIANAGATPVAYDEWVKMSGTSPVVKLDAPAKAAAGFYDCTEGAAAVCNVHIHMRAGYQVELMGAGKAHRTDFDALLHGLPIRALATDSATRSPPTPAHNSAVGDPKAKN